jgi:hypothetical protein
MSIKASIRHNQNLFVSAMICFAIMTGLFACQLTQAQKKEIIDTGAIVGTAVVTHNPIPWKTIGLLIGNILGSGAIMDNRRKDLLIKVLQKAKDANEAMLANMVNGNSTNPAQ